MLVEAPTGCWTRLDSTWLDSTRLDSTRLDSTRLDSTRLDSTRLGWTQLDSISLEWARLDSTRLDRTRLDSTRLDWIWAPGGSLIGGPELTGAEPARSPERRVQEGFEASEGTCSARCRT